MRTPLFLLSLILILGSLCAGCGNEAPPESAPLTNRDSMPVMVTYGCSKLISDSGIMRYKIIAEEWRVFDHTQPPRQEFLKGIFFMRYDEKFHTDLYITADTAFWYNQSLWELRGRVFVNNMATTTTFGTELLWWDMSRHEFYSDAYMKVTTATQQLEGDHFRSNEAMTQYEIKRSKGYMPMPEEKTDTALHRPA